MPIDVRCPDGHKISAPDRMAGKKIRCPECSQLTLVPAPPATTSSAAPQTVSSAALPAEPKPVKVKVEPKVAEVAEEDRDDFFDASAAAPIRRKRPPKVPKTEDESSPAFQYVLMGATVLGCSLVGYVVGMIVAPSARQIVTEVDATPGVKADASSPLATKSHNMPGRISLNLRLPMAERDASIVAAYSPKKNDQTSPVKSGIQPVTNSGLPTQNPGLPSQNSNPPANPALLTKRPVHIITLASPIQQVVVGKSGKLLIATLPDAKQVVIVDVTKKQVIRTINVRNTDLLIAAGESKLVILDRVNCVISRYDLTSLQRELTVACEPYRLIVLGCSSEGPILGVGAEFAQLNLQTLKPSRVISNNLPASDVGNLLAAANGQSFSGWKTASQPSGMMVLKLAGETLESTQDSAELGQVIPGSDGSVFYTSLGRYSADGKSMETSVDNKPKSEWVPASTGPFYLTLNCDGEKQTTPSHLNLHSQNSDTTLATVKNVALPDFHTADQSTKLVSQRQFFLPNVDSFVSVVDNQLWVHRLNVKEELDRPAKPYLFIVSMPPSTVTRGAQMSHSVESFPKKPTIQFALEGAPAGMSISKSGLIEWKVPERFRENAVTAMIKVQGDAGLTVSQQFTLKIVDPARTGGDGSRKTAAQSTPAKSTAKPIATPIDPKSEPALQPLPPRTVDTIALPAPLTQVIVGGSGRYLIGIAPTEKQVVVIDVARRKISKTITVDDADIGLAAGASKLIVLQRGTGSISRYDLTTLEKEATVKCDPFKSLAMGSSSDGPLLAVTRTGKSEATAAVINLETLEASSSFAFPYKLDGTNLLASANGKLFTSWSTTVDPNGMGLLELDGETPKWFFEANSLGPIFPSGDSRLLYTLSGKFSATGEPIGRRIETPRLMLPAAIGPWCLSLALPEWKYTPDAGPVRASIQYQSDEDLVLGLSDIDVPPVAAKTNVAGLLSEKYDQRFYLLPESSALAILSANMDQLQIYKFDLKEELERTGVDYLEITSNPTLNLTRGKDVSHQIDVLSKRGNVRFELQSGPNGLVVTKTGVVNWKVPTILASKEIPVTVLISDDSGQEVAHTLTLINRQPKK